MSAPEASMRSVAEVWAKSRIREPGREQAIAWSTMPRADTATITKSAPRPPVRRLTSEATSVVLGSQVNSAPHLAATRNRSPIVSVAATRAPLRFTSMVNISPIGPCPKTITKSSGCGSHCTTAFRHVFSGSTRVARSKETPSGILSTPRSTIQSITRTYCANPPPAGSNRRDADFLVHRALGVNLAPAVEALQAGDVMKCHHAVARPVFRDASTHRHYDSRRFVTVHPRRRQQVVLDLLEVGVADATSLHPY